MAYRVVEVGQRRLRQTDGGMRAETRLQVLGGHATWVNEIEWLSGGDRLIVIPAGQGLPDVDAMRQEIERLKAELDQRTQEFGNTALIEENERLHAENAELRKYSIKELCRALQDFGNVTRDNRVTVSMFDDGSGGVLSKLGEDLVTWGSIDYWNAINNPIVLIDAACRPEPEPQPQPAAKQIDPSGVWTT